MRLLPVQTPNICSLKKKNKKTEQKKQTKKIQVTRGGLSGPLQQNSEAMMNNNIIHISYHLPLWHKEGNNRLKMNCAFSYSTTGGHSRGLKIEPSKPQTFLCVCVCVCESLCARFHTDEGGGGRLGTVLLFIDVFWYSGRELCIRS